MTSCFVRKRSAAVVLIAVVGCGSGDDPSARVADGDVESVQSAADASHSAVDGSVEAGTVDAAVVDAAIDAALPHDPAFVAFQAVVPALPGFGFDTKLQPMNSPVQIQLKVTSSGEGTVSARAQSSGSESEPAVHAVNGSGNLALYGSFTVEARLVIGIDGLPTYDGPLPGLQDVLFGFNGQAFFDPFLLDDSVTVEAEVPEVELPAVALPIGLPGTVALGVAEGSTVNFTFEGECAAIDGDQAHYTGRLSRGGGLKLLVRVSVDVPGLGWRTFDIPTFSIPITLPARGVDLGKKTVRFGAPPEQPGESATLGTCSE